MYDFIYEIDKTLGKKFEDIENNIKLKTNLCETALQIFAEKLIKLINDREQIVIENKITLGNCLFNDKFVNVLKTKYNFTDELIMNLNVINNHSNDHKHYDRNEFINKELKKMYRKLIYATLNYYNVIFDKNLVINDIDEHYDRLLNNSDLKNKIKLEIKNSYEKDREDYKLQLKTQELMLKNKQQQLELAIKEVNSFKDTKNKLLNLENENSKYNLKIDELNEKIAKLECKVNDNDIDEIIKEKEKLEDELDIKTHELETNQEEIKKLKLNNSINPTIDIDKNEKMIAELKDTIYELNEKIDYLENYKLNLHEEENDELFKLKLKLDRKIIFDNSYVQDDCSYVLKNITKRTCSESKYKQFYAVINNFMQRGQKINKSDFLLQNNFNDKELKEIIRIQMLILHLIKNDRLKDSVWRINYVNGSLELLKVAIDDLMMYVSDLTSMAGIDFKLPKLKLTAGKYIEDQLVTNFGYNIEFNHNIKYMYYIEDYEDIVIDDELKSDKVNNINIWIEKTIKYKINKNHKPILEKFLKLFFDYDTFKQGQFEIISHALTGKSTIGILPTGAGKSIVYQMFGLLEPKIIIVIAPTIELIKDQCRVLKERFNITRVSEITSRSEINKSEELDKLGHLQNLITFISPERLQSAKFRSKLSYLHETDAFDTIILDEVHCLSEWGHDFRIPYLMVAHTLKQYCKDLKFLGLTATASKSVIKDLMVELNVNDRNDIIFNETYKRDNLDFEFINFDSENELKYSIEKEINNTNVNLNGKNTNAALIFMKTHYMIDDLYSELSKEDMFGDLVGKYYSNNDGKLTTDDFINNKKSVLISTNAFGIGIDKPNIRLTIHYGIPKSLESFYQEAGRAGRETGKKAKCKIFTYKYSPYQEELINEFFDENAGIDRLKEISNNNLLKFKGDIGTNFYFLTHDLEEPETEAKQAIYILNKLDSVRNYENVSKCIFKSNSHDNDPKSKVEKNLYILHKCGIVDNWEVRYLSIGDNSKIEYMVYFDSEYKNIDYIKLKTIQYINQYPDDHKDVVNKINSFKEYKYLVYIIYYMRKWYYKNFILTRRMQLKNIYNYATKDYCGEGRSREIQNVIDDYFNISNLLNASKNGVLSYGFENDDFKSVIKKAYKIKQSELNSYIVMIESEMESVLNNKMRLYWSLLTLRNNTFEKNNAEERFKYSIIHSSLQEKNEIYKTINDVFIKCLNDEQKDIIYNLLFHIDKKIFRGIILDTLDTNDKILKKYCIPFINERFKRKGDLNE